MHLGNAGSRAARMVMHPRFLTIASYRAFVQGESNGRHTLEEYQSFLRLLKNPRKNKVKKNEYFWVDRKNRTRIHGDSYTIVFDAVKLGRTLAVSFS